MYFYIFPGGKLISEWKLISKSLSPCIRWVCKTNQTYAMKKKYWYTEDTDRQNFKPR